MHDNGDPPPIPNLAFLINSLITLTWEVPQNEQIKESRKASLPEVTFIPSGHSAVDHVSQAPALRVYSGPCARRAALR